MEKVCYKSSKYNIYYSQDNQNYYVYNLLNRTLIRLRWDEKNLLDTGFVVPFDKNESEDFINSYYSSIDNNDLHLIIMSSTGCDFDCKYCYFGYKNMNLTRKSSESIVKFVEKQIDKFKGIRIDWFGGEPLLAKEEVLFISKKLKQIAKNYKIPIIGTVTTNGHNLDINTFNELVSFNIVNFQITIDGMKEIHDYYRPLKNGKGTYDSIIENLDKINIYGKGYYHINIRNNITNNNYGSCKDFEKVFKIRYGNNRKFSLTKYPVKNWGGDKINLIEDELVKRDSYLKIINMSTEDDLFSSLNSMRCYASKKNAFVITPDCKVWKCSHIDENFGINSSNFIGEINSDGTNCFDEELIYHWCNTLISPECLECKFLPECIYNHCPKHDLHPYQNCKNIIYKSFVDKI